MTRAKLISELRKAIDNAPEERVCAVFGMRPSANEVVEETQKLNLRAAIAKARGEE